MRRHRGDTGLAFILPSEEGGPVIEGAVDVGWWPMAAWGVKMRLGFVGRASGREFRYLAGDDSAYRRDAAAHYRERFKPEVETSIAAASHRRGQQSLGGRREGGTEDGS